MPELRNANEWRSPDSGVLINALVESRGQPPPFRNINSQPESAAFGFARCSRLSS